MQLIEVYLNVLENIVHVIVGRLLQQQTATCKRGIFF